MPRHRCALRGFEMESALVILADCPYQERKSRVAGLRERRRVALCYVLLLAEWFLDVPGQDMKGCCFSYHVRQVCVVCSLLGRKRVCVCVLGGGEVSTKVVTNINSNILYFCCANGFVCRAVLMVLLINNSGSACEAVRGRNVHNEYISRLCARHQLASRVWHASVTDRVSTGQCYLDVKGDAVICINIYPYICMLISFKATLT